MKNSQVVITLFLIFSLVVGVWYLVYSGERNSEDNPALIKTDEKNTDIANKVTNEVDGDQRDFSLLVDWAIASKEGVSFKYPANLFKIDGPEVTLPKGQLFYLESIKADSSATIYVEVLDQTFDLNQIEGTYARVDNPKQVKVGNRIGYGYLEGDAGWGSYRVVTPFGTNQTLRIMFGSSGEDLYPFYNNEQLQNQILSTFVLSK